MLNITQNYFRKGFGANSIWINNLRELTKIINDYKENSSEEPLVILCSVPDKLPESKDYCSSEMLFLEAAELMMKNECQIISTSDPKYFHQLCAGGYLILKNLGIWKSDKFLNLSKLWYLKNRDNKIIRFTRSPKRVVDGLISLVKNRKGLNFILRPGSLRIYDNVARGILESKLTKIYVLDIKSLIEKILDKALESWNKNPNIPVTYLDGNQTFDLSKDEIRLISKQFIICLISVAESYNTRGYASLIAKVIKKIKSTLPSDLRIWIAFPNSIGKSYKLGMIDETKLNKAFHYIIIIDLLNEKNSSSFK